MGLCWGGARSAISCISLCATPTFALLIYVKNSKKIGYSYCFFKPLLRMPPGPTTVLVLGHSFVRRLRDFLVNLSRANGARRITSHTWSNLNLDTQNFTVFYHGIGGLTIQKSYQELYIISELRPDLIFIQLGENDVDKIGSQPPRHFQPGDPIHLSHLVSLPKHQPRVLGPAPSSSSATYFTLQVLQQNSLG